MKKVRYKTSEGTQEAYFINADEFRRILQEERERTIRAIDARYSNIEKIIEKKIQKYFQYGNDHKIVLAKNPEMAAVTKQLLKNYRRIVEAVDNVILERCRLEQNYVESFEWYDKLMRGKDPDILLDIMEENSYVTASLICRLETAIQQYNDLVPRADLEAIRRCEILTCYYISKEKKNVPELSEIYGVKKTTIYSSMQRAVEEIAALLFPDQK